MIKPALTLSNAIAHWARYVPDRPAICSSGKTRTFRDIDLWASKAHTATANRIEPGSVVAVATPDDGLAIATWIGVSRAGCRFLPLREVFSSSQVENVLKDAGVTLVLVDDSSSIRSYLIEQDRAPLLSFEEVGRASTTTLHAPQKIYHHDDLICILLTSGTTGVPDLVPKSLYALQSELTQWIIELGLTRNSRVAIGIPSYHTGGFVIAAAQLLTGGSVSFVPLFGAKALADEMERFRPTVVFLTNSQYRETVRESSSAASIYASVATALSLGDHLPRQTWNSIRQNLACKVLVCWGNTEGLGTVNDTDDFGELGRPFLCDEITVVDPNGYRLPHDSEGFIAGKSDNCFTASLDTSANEGDLVVSDDLGRISAEGRLKYASRSDSVIKTAEWWIPFSEAEDRIRDIESVLDAAVVPGADPGEVGVALVIRGDREIAWTRRAVKSILAELQVGHSQVFQVNEIPTTSSGKVNRFALRQIMKECTHEEGEL